MSKTFEAFLKSDLPVKNIVTSLAEHSSVGLFLVLISLIDLKTYNISNRYTTRKNEKRFAFQFYPISWSMQEINPRHNLTTW